MALILKTGFLQMVKKKSLGFSFFLFELIIACIRKSGDELYVSI